jgi:hypothetical protein
MINENLVTGSFIISKSCEDTNYSIWEEVYRFKLISQIPTMHLCKDFTIEQGKNYIYSLNTNNIPAKYDENLKKMLEDKI